MGLRQHTARVVPFAGALHPRMGLVVAGFGTLSVEVRCDGQLVATRCEGEGPLAGSEMGDVYLCVYPAQGSWPARSTLEVVPLSYGTPFTRASLQVGPDGPLPPAPTLVFEERWLDGPPSPGAPAPETPPGSPFPVGPPPFAPVSPFGARPEARHALGALTFSGPAARVDVWYEGHRASSGLVLSGEQPVVRLTEPGRLHLIGAMARDLAGQACWRGDVTGSR